MLPYHSEMESAPSNRSQLVPFQLSNDREEFFPKLSITKDWLANFDWNDFKNLPPLKKIWFIGNLPTQISSVKGSKNSIHDMNKITGELTCPWWMERMKRLDFGTIDGVQYDGETKKKGLSFDKVSALFEKDMSYALGFIGMLLVEIGNQMRMISFWSTFSQRLDRNQVTKPPINRLVALKVLREVIITMAKIWGKRIENFPCFLGENGIYTQCMKLAANDYWPNDVDLANITKLIHDYFSCNTMKILLDHGSTTFLYKDILDAPEKDDICHNDWKDDTGNVVLYAIDDSNEVAWNPDFVSLLMGNNFKNLSAAVIPDGTFHLIISLRMKGMNRKPNRLLRESIKLPLANMIIY